MDNATWCRTPAAASAARRLRPEVSKNSSTALSSNEGELARSITTCVPAMASLRPSPVMVLTPSVGARRACGAVLRRSHAGAADNDDLHLHLSLSSQRAGSVLDEGQKIGIDHVGVRRAQAMRELVVDLQGARLEELRGQQRGIGD